MDPVRRRGGEAIELLVIAASTGGPAALAQLLPALPACLPVPVLIVQHLLPAFMVGLAARFDAQLEFAVAPARTNVCPRAGEIWFAPGDRHLLVQRRPVGALYEPGALQLVLDDGPRRHGCRPSADVLFESAAAACGPRVLAVILTGMGRDGRVGAQHIVDAGGCVFVQDRASSVVWSMPGAVAQAGLAERVLPLADLAPTIVAALGRRLGLARPAMVERFTL